MDQFNTQMPTYKSNAQQVLGGLMKQFEGVKKETIGKIVRTVAADLVGSNLTRIHNDGKAVDGSPIGSYKSKEYKEKRQKAGRETDYVNLSFSGKLSKEFNQDTVNDTEIGIGFLTDYSANISEYMEERFGKKIWGVTQDDEKVALDIQKEELGKAFL